MRIYRHCVFGFWFIAVLAFGATTPTVTLYPPVDPVTKKYDEGKSLFSFKRGLLKEVTKSKSDWDLGYGFLAIRDEDWFRLHFAPENRSVIKDLGEFNWDEHFTVPVLEPRPAVEKGKQRQITIDSSGDTHKQWAETTQEFAKVVLHHMYLLHVKDETADFYVMFRVEEHEQQRRCTISWRRVPDPEIKVKGQ
jgi:hypothetical protein